MAVCSWDGEWQCARGMGYGSVLLVGWGMAVCCSWDGAHPVRPGEAHAGPVAAVMDQGIFQLESARPDIPAGRPQSTWLRRGRPRGLPSPYRLPQACLSPTSLPPLSMSLPISLRISLPLRSPFNPHRTTPHSPFPIDPPRSAAHFGPLRQPWCSIGSRQSCPHRDPPTGSASTLHPEPTASSLSRTTAEAAPHVRIGAAYSGRDSASPTAWVD